MKSIFTTFAIIFSLAAPEAYAQTYSFGDGSESIVKLKKKKKKKRYSKAKRRLAKSKRDKKSKRRKLAQVSSRTKSKARLQRKRRARRAKPNPFKLDIQASNAVSFAMTTTSIRDEGEDSFTDAGYTWGFGVTPSYKVHRIVDITLGVHYLNRNVENITNQWLMFSPGARFQVLKYLNLGVGMYYGRMLGKTKFEFSDTTVETDRFKSNDLGSYLEVGFNYPISKSLDIVGHLRGSRSWVDLIDDEQEFDDPETQRVFETGGVGIDYSYYDIQTLVGVRLKFN